MHINLVLHQNPNLSLDLLLKQLLQSNRIRRELGDTLPELLRGHSILVQVEAEERLVLEVAALGDVEVGGIGRVELLGDRVGRVVELLQEVGLGMVSYRRPHSVSEGQTYRDGQVVAASELGDLAGVTERSSHDNGLVAVLLVVVEDALHRLDTGVLLGGVFALVGSLEPVEDTANERRDKEGTRLSTGDGLHEGEHEGQVAVDLVLSLEDVGCLDTLPGGSDLDQNAIPRDAERLVELQGSV